MRFKIIVIILGLFALSSCKTGDFVNIKPKPKVDVSSLTPECREFINNDVRKKWKVHKSGDCYLYDKEFYNQLEVYNECFIGFTFEEIESIFGKPNRQEAHYRKYHIGSECNPTIDYLTLSFVGSPEKGKISQVAFDQIRSD